MINTALSSINIYYLMVVIYALSLTILLLIQYVQRKKELKKIKAENEHELEVERERLRIIDKSYRHELEVRDNVHAGQLKKVQQELRDQKNVNREKAFTMAFEFNRKNGGTFALMMEYAEQIYKFYGGKSL